MTFVNLRESGYSCSSIDLLKSLKRVGAMKGVRSLRIAGLILYISSLFWIYLFHYFDDFFECCVSEFEGGIVGLCIFDAFVVQLDLVLV